MRGGTSSDGTQATNRARRRKVHGAALSGGALLAGQLAGAMPAQAVNIVVTSLTDDGVGTTLRDALDAANGTPGVPDVITFQAGLAGPILLDDLQGPLQILDDVTITGPGTTPAAAAITIDGGGDTGVFYIQSAGAVTITGLIIDNGDGGEGGGGGILAFNTDLTLDDMVITNNICQGFAGYGGAGIAAFGSELTITDSVVSGNTCDFGFGGGVLALETELTVINTTFDDNFVAFGGGGGLSVVGGEGNAVVHDTEFLENRASVGGGMLVAGNLDTTISLSRFINNESTFRGGGLHVGADGGEGQTVVSDSTFDDNSSGIGGGVAFSNSFFSGGDPAGRLVIERSTLSGNTAGEGGGFGAALYDSGGIGLEAPSVLISNSTVSGNRVDADGGEGTGVGGGISVFHADDGYGTPLVVDIEHSTVADNLVDNSGGATAFGGGISRAFGSVFVNIDHTIVADNVAAGGGNDLFGNFDVRWSLIEDPLGATLGSDVSNLTVVDPQLEPLADNGGTNLTHMIPTSSPAYNSGDPFFTVPPIHDQRGLARVSGAGSLRNIDRGAVERQLVASSLPAVVNQSVNWHLRESLTSGPYTVDPFVYGTRPLTVVMGNWDGPTGLKGKTPGIFSAGSFKLDNQLGNGTDQTIIFGHPNGYPVAGDFNGDGTDDVAVYRNGTWQIRLSTGATSTISFGSSTWPFVVPVAGDWNGDGTDGIGFYNYSSGTWNLRQTAFAGGAVLTPFVYKPAANSYPVVGDWDGDGIDTVGAKTGTTWQLRNTNSAGAPDPNYTFVFTVDPTGVKDLPLVWSYGTP